MATSPLVRPLEALLNRHIQASTPARALLASLAGKAFAVQLETPVGGRLLRLRVLAAEQGIVITTGDEPADASVTGTPLGLIALLAGRAGGRFTAAGVTIGGDAEVAATFEKLLGHARPDLEAELARLFGDLPAHYAGQAARGILGWSRRAADALARNVGEFLTEEGRDLVSRPELDGWLGDVDRVREDVDRAEARLSLLAARLAQPGR
jgi:ubiquinone biosynthesis protein UbiJ